MRDGSWQVMGRALACRASHGTRRAQALAGGPAGRLVGMPVASVAAALAVFSMAGVALPKGLPFGVVLLGMVIGGLNALTAMGIVLIYRAARVLNFAQADVGGLAAAVAVVLVAGKGLPYFAALPVGLAVAVGCGALIDATVVRRLFTAPRLIVTVATIGVAQVLGAGEVVLPSLFTKLKPFTTFTTPFNVRFTVGPIVFDGNDVMAIAAVPVVLVVLWWFLVRTDTGTAIRAAADSGERAQLLGIPVRKLSRITWMVAGGLSGVASMLSAPVLGVNLGVVAGPVALLAPIAAAAVGGMESLPITCLASLGIGVLQQAIFWSFPQSSSADVALFGIVMLALLLRRRRRSRMDDGGLGSFVAFEEVRPVPPALRRLPEVRIGRAGAFAVAAAVVLVVPLTSSGGHLVAFTLMAIYAMVAVSLVILTGWAGQISLGQFAFAAAGGGTTASLLVHTHADLFVALMASAAVAGTVAVVIGLPALRLSGLFLSVATMAFAVPVSTYFLSALYFPDLAPSNVVRPRLFGHVDLASPRTFYLFCLVFVAASLWIAHNYRSTRVGRATIAVRDNERGAASFGVSPLRTKVIAFALSGVIAGIAGGLYVLLLEGVPFSGFNPEQGFTVFTMVVIGGLGSLPGAVLGAIYVEWAQFFLSSAAQLLATGAGMLLLLLVLPGGIGAVLYRVRDGLLRMVARRHGIEAPSLAGSRVTWDHGEPAGEIPVTAPTGVGARSTGGPVPTVQGSQVPGNDALPLIPRMAAPAVSTSAVNASYGQVQVLFGVDLTVEGGDIVALLGTNGAGKSTLLRVMAGLMPAQAGAVTLFGRDITSFDPVDRVRGGLVMVPGGRGVFGSLSVTDNLRMATWLRRRDRARRRNIDEMMDLFPVLRSRAGTLASQLSGGEQQMLTIAQSLLCQPRVLMIDELSLGLAPTVVSELLDVVRRLRDRGITIIVVEQSVNVATAIASESVFMERGQVRFRGSTSTLAERPDLARAVFLTGAAGAVGDRRAGPELARSHTNGNGKVPNVSSERVSSPEEPVLDDVPALELQGVGVRYGGVRAIDQVSMVVHAGEIVGIIGSNGAGKTTLLDVCSGFLPPDSGRVLLRGHDMTAISAAERAERGVGRIFQDARLFPSLTVAENVAVAHERHIEVREPIACMLRIGSTDDSERRLGRHVNELLRQLGLERYRDAFVSELSTGTRRIVEIACAMAHRPSLLLLDEPTSGVAQRESEAMADLLLRLHRDTAATFVIIEHDVPLVSSLADRLICMHLGRVIAEGAPQEVLADPLVISSYLGENDAVIGRSGTLVR